MSNVIDTLYKCRTNFSIIGLTGYSVKGLGELSSIMKDGMFYKRENLRKPIEIVIPDRDSFSVDNVEAFSQDNSNIHKAISGLIFKREYTICYNYISHMYSSYEIIKYNDVLWLYSFLFFIDRKFATDGDTLKKCIYKLVQDKFSPNQKEHDVDYVTYIDKNKSEYPTYHDWEEVLDKYTKWDKLFDDLSKKELNGALKEDIKADKAKDIAYWFQKSTAFHDFISFFNKEFTRLDYYCYHYFYHRLGMVIRNVGDPLVPAQKSYERRFESTENLYACIKLINVLIKGFRYNPDESKKPCRVVIDSLKNSMEAVFLRERYSAFYFVSVCDEMQSKDEDIIRNEIAPFYEPLKTNKVASVFYERLLNLQVKKMENLRKLENRTKEYSAGNFSSPNIEQCVADAEIHIENISLKEDRKNNPNKFFSLAEQWLKYAALIEHPGLITPTSDERCMAVAYSAKFNSGCISRQVGAVITNKDHSIRTIGWNDVPYGQIPCSLRELNELVPFEDDKIGLSCYMYSEYERSNTKVYDKEFSFIDCVQKEYSDILTKHLPSMDGLPYSFCFKSLHNTYEGEKNQVHTRSLHAEENAMLQMVKYGGQPLINGIIYVTASPCELCSKKLYQIGVRRIVFIDDYPGIAKANITNNGFKRPHLDRYQGVYGRTYYKLYQPLMQYKDELGIRNKGYFNQVHTRASIINELREIKDLHLDKTILNEEEYKEFKKIIEKIKDKIKQ